MENLGAKTGAPSVWVTVEHESGVEIISSRTFVQGKTPSAPTAGGEKDKTAAATVAGDAPDTVSRLRHVRTPINATLSAGDPGPLADDVRGDYRLRANLLDSDGTANEQADNRAHQLVDARRVRAQADLKDALAAFDAGKRDGASRTGLDQIQARIRTDLDEIHFLTHAQQSGAQ